MTHYRLILLSIMVAAAASPALAGSGRYRINTDQVAAAVNRMGMQVVPDQVTLLAEVVSNTSAPRLTVRSISPWSNQRMMARLECESSDQCLPFVVSLKLTPRPDVDPVANTQAELPAGLPAVSGARRFAVHIGTPATLLLDGERVHIRLAVICLESGAPGQTIRVSDRDHKTVFHAQVVDGSTLKGTL
ncbi:MAG TPA: hypothetical protein VHW46_06310 [Terracidiphilus sp.]|jgi:hypothetical protein|nr:hypothetical protein [Terracidiphilus sp.]